MNVKVVSDNRESYNLTSSLPPGNVNLTSIYVQCWTHSECTAVTRMVTIKTESIHGTEA